MIRRLLNKLKFEVERFILYRLTHRLLLIALLIGLIAFLGGVAVFLATDDFGKLTSAIWWSFLRLTDPGYIGDDVGGAKRTISTIISVLGYVIFLGALVAVLTQALHQQIGRLQSGLTPISANNHILILGWTNRTRIMIKQLLLSDHRIRTFLRRRGAARLKIVVLMEDLTPERAYEVRTFLGSLWNPRQLILRSGSPVNADHLERVDYLNAGVVIYPSGEFSSDHVEYPDGRAIMTLLSMQIESQRRQTPSLPPLVVELHDPRKSAIAANAYRGPLISVESDQFAGRLITQTVRNPGVSHIYMELLTHEEGNEIYLRDFPDLVGIPVGELATRFRDAILLGVYSEESRRFRSLNAAATTPYGGNDRLVLIAAHRDSHDVAISEPGPNAPPEIERTSSLPSHSGRKRILLLGWNRLAPLVLRGFTAYADQEYEIDSLALIEPEERIERVRNAGYDLDRLEFNAWVGDYTSVVDLEQVDPVQHDAIVIFSSEWLESASESDVRSVLGFQILRTLLGKQERKWPQILVQLMNYDNSALFPEEECEVLPTPVVLSHLISQVALQGELRDVYEELFGPHGAEMFFRWAERYDLVGKDVTFADVERAAWKNGEIAIGLQARENGPANGGILLNPDRTRRWNLQADDFVVILQDRPEL